MKGISLLLTAIFFYTASIAQIAIQAQSASFMRKTPAMGLNGNAMYNNTWTNPALADSVKNINPAILRYPGGTPSNYWDWQTGWPAAPFSACYPNAPSPALTVRYEELTIGLDSCDADMLNTLNVQHETLNDQVQGLQHAASLGIPIRFLELGNEHNLNCDHLNAIDYATLCKTWCDTLKAYYPLARIALVGGDVPSISPTWISEINAHTIDFDAFSFHVYPLPAATPFHVASVFSQAYEITGSRYTQSHFSSMPDKEVWVTEYNMSAGNTGPANTWTHTLFLMAMMDTLIQHPMITMLLPWAYSGPNTFLQALNYNDFSMKATGLAAKLINDISRGTDSVRKITFLPAQYQSAGSIAFPSLYGYTFYGNTPARNLLVNLSATTYNLNNANIHLGATATYTIFTADTAKLIDHGVQDINITTGVSNGLVTIPPFSVVEVFSGSTGSNDLEAGINKNIPVLYPNPASHVLYLTSGMSGLSYAIIDPMGAYCSSGRVGQGIDVSHLPKGIYILKVYDDRHPARMLRFSKN